MSTYATDSLTQDKPKRTKEEKAADELHQKVVKLAKHYCEAWSTQRKEEKDDLKFQVPAMQWDDLAINARRGMAGGNGQLPVPARPMLSISLIEQPIQLVNNQMRQAHLGVGIHPLSPDAEEEVAEVIQGIYRDTERNSRAELARTWAFDRASKCGMGVYRITTEYDDAGGNPFDQVIRIRRILDQSQVYLDPAAVEPDFSDGRCAFHLAWYTVPAFKAAFPGVAVPKGNRSVFDDDENMPEWIERLGDATTAVCVAEFWEVQEKDETIYLLVDGTVVTEEELAGLPEKPEIQDQRKRQKREVYTSKHTADGVIEGPDLWAGRYIPFIPVIGNELQPFDDKRIWVGIIRPAKDSQRAYNYSISQAVESVALEPKAPFHAFEGQLEGHMAEWQQANIRNFSVLTSKPVFVGGQLLPAPTRMQVDGSKMTMSLQLASSMQSGIQSTTKQFDPGLGLSRQSGQSGKAISELQEQAESANSHYVANLADISMAYEARVILDLIPAIYDRPGRIARTLEEDDETDEVMLNAPFTQGNDGAPQRVPTQGPDGQPIAPPPEAKQYDLRKGIYGVSISIGKSYQSRLQQGADEIGQILQSHPELFLQYGDIYLQFRDFPGAEEMSERAKRNIEKNMPWLLAPKSGEKPTPDQLQMKVQAQEAQIQQMQQQLQAAGQQIQMDTAKQQAGLQKAQMDNATKTEIEQMKAQIQILIKKMDIDAENARTGAELVHESKESDKDKIHDMVLAGQAQANEVERAAIGTIKPLDLNFRGSNDKSLGEEDQY